MRMLFYTAVCSLLALGCGPEPKVLKRPNIVLILADDLGYGDVGSYGQEKIKTPNIDLLAAEGVRFTQFYAGATVCAPSRSVLMTGQHTGHTYIRGNKEAIPEGQEPLADSVETLAQLLQRSGYVTGAFGKWGLGMMGTSGSPTNKGFDTFFGYNCQRQAHRYYPNHLWHNDQQIVLEGNGLENKTVYAPELIQQRTLQFIEDNQRTPFFLFVPTILPHAELLGPADEHDRMYAGKFKEQAYSGDDYGPDATEGGYASTESPRAAFAAMVSRLDAYIGQIVEKLDQLGLTENTIILFSSDNGPHAEGGADPVFFNSAGGLRGIKRDLYEGGIRVPFIVRWPGNIVPSQTSDHVAYFGDLMPTLVEISNAETPAYTDGVSFLPTLLGDGKGQKQHRYLYWEFHEQGGKQAVRFGKWKAIRLQAKHDPNGRIELYNLESDLAEAHDVAETHPEIVKEATRYMNDAHQESSLFPFFTE